LASSLPLRELGRQAAQPLRAATPRRRPAAVARRRGPDTPERAAYSRSSTISYANVLTALSV